MRRFNEITGWSHLQKQFTAILLIRLFDIKNVNKHCRPGFRLFIESVLNAEVRFKLFRPSGKSTFSLIR